jgi:anti-sigma factor RsiW
MRTNTANKPKKQKIDLNCKKTTSLIMDYIMGALEPTDSIELEKHLSICPDCVAFLNTYKKTINLVSSFYNIKSQKLKKRLGKSLRTKINKGEF